MMLLLLAEKRQAKVSRKERNRIFKEPMIVRSIVKKNFISTVLMLHFKE